MYSLIIYLFILLFTEVNLRGLYVHSVVSTRLFYPQSLSSFHLVTLTTKLNSFIITKEQTIQVISARLDMTLF